MTTDFEAGLGSIQILTEYCSGCGAGHESQNASKIRRNDGEVWRKPLIIIIIIIIYPLPRGSLGHHRWCRNQFPPFSPVLHCPLGLGELQACPFPDVVFQPLSLSASSSSPFHRALQDGFGQTWWTGDKTTPLKFASLYSGQEVFVWSDCSLDLGTGLPRW